MARGIPARLTAAEGRKFGWTLGIAFGVVASISWWRGHQIPPLVLGSLSALFLVAGTVFPSRLGPVYRGWMGFAHAISKVTTPIFMGIVFYLVLTPIGLVVRLVKGNPLRHKAGGEGFWIARATRTPDPAMMKHQF